MSWVKKINHPSEMLNKGDEVTVKVLSVDREKKRVALGMKQLEQDPWEGDIPRRFSPGDTVKGKVTKLTNFGAFVEIEPGLEGLLHISELSEKKVENPEEVVKVGQDVEVRILRIDAKDRKIGLSLVEDGGAGGGAAAPAKAPAAKKGGKKKEAHDDEEEEAESGIFSSKSRKGDDEESEEGGDEDEA